MTETHLVLEDGTVLPGQPFGAAADAVFELVFNTSMTGYQEIITDPSYRGQGVLFTVSHIGNVGINREDDESAAPQVSAVVTRSLSPAVSNWRASRDLSGWLGEHGVPGISGVDTRTLTRKLRDGGTMKAALSTQGSDPVTLLAMARAWPGLDGVDMVKAVTCAEPYHWTGDAGDKWVTRKTFEVFGNLEGLEAGPRVVLYDFGAKRNIMRHLAAAGLRVTVVPAATPAGDVLAMQPAGVLLSNGPGDPAGLPYAVEATRQLIEAGVPIFGICLGHQLAGRALGGTTSRLKFGHHGGNHPVQDLRTGKIAITAQNHNYQVDTASLDPAEVEITHVSLNDGSLEGMRLRRKPVFCVQYHPEAAPGQPLLVDQFMEDAYEIDVDALCDGERVVIGAIMQHIEEAGVHSGDSACVLPPYKVSAYHLDFVRDYTERLGLALGVRGLMNVQFAIKEDIVYVLEVNPRASRTVPFASKATGLPLARIAAQVMAGKTLAELGVTEEPRVDGFFVKEAVLPFKKLLGSDALLGPEMRSTGEVMGHASRFGHAFAKAQLAAGVGLPLEGAVLLSVNDFDKGAALKIARDLKRLGFHLMATPGTADTLRRAGLPVQTINKVSQGSPHVVDAVRSGQVDLILNTPLGPRAQTDGLLIRQAATAMDTPLLTTLSAAAAAVAAIRALREKDFRYRSLQMHFGRS